jgi:uncharacterized integral membrane protein
LHYCAWKRWSPSHIGNIPRAARGASAPRRSSERRSTRRTAYHTVIIIITGFIAIIVLFIVLKVIEGVSASLRLLQWVFLFGVLHTLLLSQGFDLMALNTDE